MANDSGSQHEFNVVMLTSLYWANYYKHADMPVEKECFLTLAQLGVIAKIEENTAEFMKFGEVFDGGLRCTGKAGVESKKIAESASDPNFIICQRYRSGANSFCSNFEFERRHGT